jgi:hypothetical protein
MGSSKHGVDHNDRVVYKEWYVLEQYNHGFESHSRCGCTRFAVLCSLVWIEALQGTENL